MRWLALLPALEPLARIAVRLVTRRKPDALTADDAERLAADAVSRIEDARSRRSRQR